MGNLTKKNKTGTASLLSTKTATTHNHNNTATRPEAGRRKMGDKGRNRTGGKIQQGKTNNAKTNKHTRKPKDKTAKEHKNNNKISTGVGKLCETTKKEQIMQDNTQVGNRETEQKEKQERKKEKSKQEKRQQQENTQDKNTQEQNTCKASAIFRNKIQAYRDTERRRKITKQKERANFVLRNIHKKWINKQVQEEAKKTTKASEEMNMRPIWEFAKNTNKKQRNKSPHKKTRWNAHK